MPQFVSEGAEKTCKNPTEGVTVELVVRVGNDSLATVEEWVIAHDGNVKDSLDHGLLEIELPETHVSSLCDLTSVSSVERADETIGVLDEGN